MRSLKSAMTSCPCGSNKPYHKCCEKLHLGTAAPDAESLMRSRYTAYVLGLEDYLINTWYKDTRPNSLNLTQDSAIKWLDLRIILSKQVSQDTAMVEFIARYEVNGNTEQLHENSRFLKINTHWFYVDGDFL